MNQPDQVAERGTLVLLLLCCERRTQKMLEVFLLVCPYSASKLAKKV